MNAIRRMSGGVVAAIILASGVMYANASEAAVGGGLCGGLAAAIERASGLAKLILQVIARFFGCD